MELWITITIAAAFLQNIRSTLQKHLKGVLSNTGATFVRFGFGIPFAAAYFLLLMWWTGASSIELNPQFWLWVCIAAIAQILATAMLLHVLSFRNFAVGTAYSRTEPIQTAIFALVLFGETIGTGGVFAIAISLVGVMIISIARTEIKPSALMLALTSKTALWGLASGTLFGLAAVGFREATHQVVHETFFIRSAVTLCCAIVLQSVVMMVWMAYREPDQFGKILENWKPSLLVGFVGATASFGWFTAFTLQQAALVKVVAQIEMLFTFASSVFFFKEHINRWEVIGCLLITAGIVMLILID